MAVAVPQPATEGCDPSPDSGDWREDSDGTEGSARGTQGARASGRDADRLQYYNGETPLGECVGACAVHAAPAALLLRREGAGAKRPQGAERP
jgi:hypothetical protein